MNHPGTEMPGFTGWRLMAPGGGNDGRYADRHTRSFPEKSKLQCMQLRDEARFILYFKAAQVKPEGIVANVPDHRLR